MNFSRHRVSRGDMLSDMMNYCHKIIEHRRKENDRYKKLTVSWSSCDGVKVENREESKTIVKIDYDDRNNIYYFLETERIGDRELSKRVLIYSKKDFYAYFDTKLNNSL